MSLTHGGPWDPAALRAARDAAGWSVAEAVRQLRRRSSQVLPGHDALLKAWRRWEKGTTPGHLYRPLLVGLFGQLGGPDINLSGDWWAAWQTSLDGDELVAIQPVRFHQQGDEISIRALRRGRPLDRGGYLWRGELRLWEDATLMGWYAADDGPVRSKGTLYFTLNAQGHRMRGRWVGMSVDGDLVTGFGAVARTEEDTGQLIRSMINGASNGASSD